ncbi:MAG: hypothetical protein ABH823_05805 [bacterium]
MYSFISDDPTDFPEQASDWTEEVSNTTENITGVFVDARVLAFAAYVTEDGSLGVADADEDTEEIDDFELEFTGVPYVLYGIGDVESHPLWNNTVVVGSNGIVLFKN